MEEEREPRRRPLDFGHKRLGVETRAEEVPPQVLGSRLRLVLEPLVHRKLADQGCDRPAVVRPCRPDRKRWVGRGHVHGGPGFFDGLRLADDLDVGPLLLETRGPFPGHARLLDAERLKSLEADQRIEAGVGHERTIQVEHFEGLEVRELGQSGVGDPVARQSEGLQPSHGRHMVQDPVAERDQERCRVGGRRLPAELKLLQFAEPRDRRQVFVPELVETGEVQRLDVIQPCDRIEVLRGDRPHVPRVARMERDVGPAAGRQILEADVPVDHETARLEVRHRHEVSVERRPVDCERRDRKRQEHDDHGGHPAAEPTAPLEPCSEVGGGDGRPRRHRCGTGTGRARQRVHGLPPFRDTVMSGGPPSSRMSTL